MEKDTQQELERLNQALQSAEEEPETEETVSEEDYLWATEGIDLEDAPEEDNEEDYEEECSEDYEEEAPEEFDETYYTEGDTAPKKPGHIWFPILALVLMAAISGYILWQYIGVLR